MFKTNTINKKHFHIKFTSYFSATTAQYITKINDTNDIDDIYKDV